MSIETVAVVDEPDEADEYSLEDCTFPSTQLTETYKDVSISNELTSEQIREAESLVEQVPGCTDEFTRTYRYNTS